MKGSLVLVLVLVLALSVLTTACGSIDDLVPTGPSSTLVNKLALAPEPAPGTAGTVQQIFNGTVRPVADGGPRCYFALYSCETYDFALNNSGGIDVTLSWQGNERALMVQLYRADVGLIHEDLARRGAAPTISFNRPDLAAMNYQLRVVSMETGNAIPFTLTLSRWEN
jgi:hypothetical protein